MEEDEQPERLQRLAMQDDEALPFCPSFSSYSSSSRFAEIAAKVATEFHSDDDPPPLETSNRADSDEDFEFSFVRSDFDVTAAEEIFNDGQIREVFPIFNRDLLHDRNQNEDKKLDESSLRLPLKKLFVEDGVGECGPPPSTSTSSSEADELDSVPAEIYCVWRPKPVEESPSRCQKSNSTGSASKPWKLRDLLRRSNSDGKDSFLFLTPKNREQMAGKQGRDEDSKEKREQLAGKVKAKGVSAGGEKVAPPSAHEEFYLRNRAWKEGDKRRSYLPYRQDLVGFFGANVNGFGKAFPPF